MNSVRIGQAILLVAGTIASYVLLRRLAHSRSASSPPARYGSGPEGPPVPDGPPQSPQQTKGVRLCQVHPHPESGTKTDIDIIAIHGLDTKSPDTWVWEPKGAHVNWLKDSHMLPGRFPTARIFTCDWPADLLEQPDFIQKKIEELARLLLAGIKSRPPVPNDSPGKEERPIVFIASCLGGIVLMKALVMASHEYLSVKRATRGIVFLATPFRGTSFQDVAKWAEPGLKVWASVQDKNVSNLLEHVKSTFELGELVRSFTTLCRENDLIDHVFAFYETGKSSLPRKVAPWLPASLSKEQPLVNRLSATPDFVPHPLPLDRPHVLMNKFCGPNDPGYVSVAGMVEILLSQVRNGRPIEKADVWIRNKRYSPKNLEIERLSGELLPMDGCYINLAIAEKSGDNIAREEGDTAQQSSPFSLLARLKLETPDEEIEAKLPNLFEPRETRDGQTRRPSRILIRGRAGVGKTTLCKKIVYEFTYGTMWRDLFDRVLWVPLRNLKLKERRIAGYNFGRLFHDEYFSQHPKGTELAEAFWNVLQDTNSSRTLFILDGLDEVSQDLDGAMFGFLEELLNQPNVVITSRPNAILPTKLDPVHLEVETIGFYPRQVTAYIENAFTNREARKRDSEKIEEVRSFLQRHPLMQGLLRIPIQLDAFCYTWNGLPGKAVSETLTAVYGDIEQSLWKKDVVNLKKRTQRQMQVARQSEISESVKDELHLLELLAFTGMHNDVIDFEPKHRDAVSEHFEPRDTNLLLDDMLGRVSFLRTSDTSAEDRDRNYHFLHLTFQEYFAARYFVRQWKTRRPLRCIKLSNGENEDMEPTAFLRKCKYSARHDILWRFVAGLLDAAAGAETLRFFETIEDEPRDLLGPTHQRLVMHCLNEVLPNDTSVFTPLRATLEEKLTQWVLFECRSHSRSQLASEVELPQRVLNAVLQASDDTNAVADLLESLNTQSAGLSCIPLNAASLLRDNSSQRLQLAILTLLRRVRRILPDEVLKAVAARFEDEDFEVRWAAVNALSKQLALSDQLLEAVAARLEDGNWAVRAAAVNALGKQPALSDQLLEAVAARLEDGNWAVRWAAVNALGKQPALSNKLLEAVAARLEDGNSTVREVAVNTLGKQPALPDKLLEAVAAQLKHKNLTIRGAAVNELGKQPALSDELLEVVAARLEHEDRTVREVAVNELGEQPALSDKLLEAVAARLEDEDWTVRVAAVDVLGKQPALSNKLLEVVAARLEHEDQTVRGAAITALGKQPALPDKLLEVVVACLKDEDRGVRGAAVITLRKQPALPDKLLEVVAACLEDKDWNVRGLAIHALGKQPALPDKLLEVVAACLEDKDRNIRGLAIHALGNQPALSNKLLEVVAAQLEDKVSDEGLDVRGVAVDALVRQSALPGEVLDPYIGALYGILLERSFSEHLYWYVADDIPYIVVGSREVPIHGRQGGYWGAIRKAQEILGVPL